MDIANQVLCPADVSFGRYVRLFPSSFQWVPWPLLAFLHHVLSSLDFVLGQLQSPAGPCGRVVILEPFALSILPRVRMALLIPTNGTPAERPLNLKEVELVQSYRSSMQSRYFLLLSRLYRFLPKAAMFAVFDEAFLRLPVVKCLGGVVVLWT